MLDQYNDEKTGRVSLSLEDAKNVTRGEILYHRINRNSDGSPQRWKVNGKVKTWVRSPERVRIPVKYGLYGYDYVTEGDLYLVSLSEKTALKGIC